MPRDIVKKSINAILVKYYKYQDLDIEKEISNVNSNYFELIYHYVLENNVGHSFKFINYVALYGFFRNISFVSICLGWCLLIASNFVGAFFLFFIASISFLGFIKFFNRYNTEILYVASVLINNDIKK